jgi:pyrroline-5-carboxylate reductase
MPEKMIGFIGGGNMAASLIGGLIADGYLVDHLAVSEPAESRRHWLESEFALRTTDDNNALAAISDIVILAVKPQAMQSVCRGIAATVVERRPLIISVAAGMRLGDIDRWLGGEHALVRCMPNTPALLRSGATALYANDKVRKGQREQAEAIMRAVGLTLWLVDEQQMDAVTALSGSGPAYFFYLLEILQRAGESLGLPAETARLLALQTGVGAAKMALESSDDCATLRQRVTSPGGTTERALAVLQAGDLSGLFHEALRGAAARAAELAEKFGDDV